MQFYNTQNLNRLTQINYSIHALKYFEKGFFILCNFRLCFKCTPFLSVFNDPDNVYARVYS